MPESAQQETHDPVECSSDSEVERLRAAAEWAELRRHSGAQQAARGDAKRGAVGGLPTTASRSRRSEEEPPAWALNALRARDVAAHVFALVDEATQRSLVALGPQARDALLVGACLDPQCWVEPGAALAARARVARRTLEAARSSRAVLEAPGALSSGAAALHAAAEVQVGGEAPLAQTRRKFRVPLLGRPLL